MVFRNKPRCKNKTMNEAVEKEGRRRWPHQASRTKTRFAILVPYKSNIQEERC